MLEAIVTFLGGSAFRMVWGEVSSFFQKRQEHQQEQEALRLQSLLEKDRFDRDMARIKLTKDLDIKEIQIAGDITIQKAEMEAFTEALKAANTPSGVKWIDGWNASIRPLAASLCLGLWGAGLVSQGFVLDDWDISLIGVVLGFYFADRSLGKRGK